MPVRGQPSLMSDSTAAAYCRAARRLRGRLADRPARMHRALRELNAPADRPSPRPATIVQTGRCERFAAEVARRMDGPVLRHAERQALLFTARRRNIGRFEANLIIAAVQHERNAVQPAPTGVAGAAPAWRAVPRRRDFLAAALLSGVVQALIVWGAWQVWCG